MNTRIFLSIFLLALVYQGLSQETALENYDLEGINYIQIEGGHHFKLIASEGKSLQAKATLEISGDIWGWAFPSKRPAFEIEMRQSGDTLFLKPPKRHRPPVIGISTYSERIEMELQIPSDKSVIQQKGKSVVVNGMFQNLQVQGASSVSCNSILQENLKLLRCLASQKLQVNGITKSPAFEQVGLGSMELSIEAKDINLTVISFNKEETQRTGSLFNKKQKVRAVWNYDQYSLLCVTMY